MTNTNTPKVWKQAPNSVNLVGVVSENNLEIKQFDERKDGVPTGNKYNAMTGDLVIRTGENENHTVRFFSKEFTNAGAQSRQFTGLQTVKDSIVSIADTESNPDLVPSRLSVTGSLELNEYAGGDGQIRSFPSVRGRFVNRLPEDDKTENKAEFDLEGMVGKVIDEFDKDGVETGRKKVSLLVPLYNSVIPIDFVVTEEGSDYVGDNFTNGSTVRIYGDMVNFRHVQKKEVEMGFGQNKVEEITTFVNELLVKGGNLYEEDVHTAKIIDPELVKSKLVEREKDLENLKTRAQQRQQGGGQPKNGFGFGGGAPATPPTTGGTPLDGNANVPNVDNMFSF